MAVSQQSRSFWLSRAFPGLLAFLFISAGYLYAFPQPNVFYAVVVLLHVCAGIVTAVLLAAFIFRLLREWKHRYAHRLDTARRRSTGWAHSDQDRNTASGLEPFYAHILLSLAGGGIVFAEWAGKRGGLAKRWEFDRSLHGLSHVARGTWRRRSLFARVAMAQSSPHREPSQCHPPT